MTFPKITNISEVLPYVEGRKDFVVIKKDGYTAIDYVVADKDTFDEPMRRECRGLKFSNEDGRILARPLHKFFNYGERIDIQYDWSKPHVILDKLDGSMVHTCILNGYFVLMTRKGVTDVAVAAEKLLTADQTDFLHSYTAAGFTVILEYVGPENQIVLFYEKPELVLIAVRDIYSGEYSNSAFEYLKNYFRTPVSYPAPVTNEFLKQIQAMPDIEGVVIAFEDGERVKLKASEYVAKHRVATGPSLEIHYLDLILDGMIDDVLGFKSGAFKDRLIDFNTLVLAAVGDFACDVAAIVDDGKDLSQKEFALMIKNQNDPVYHPMAFKLRKAHQSGAHYSIMEMAIAEFKRIFKSQKDLDENRHILGGATLKVTKYNEDVNTAGDDVIERIGEI